MKSTAELRYVVGYEYEEGIDPPKVGQEAAEMAAGAGVAGDGEEETDPHDRLKVVNYGSLPYIPQKLHKNQSKKKVGGQEWEELLRC